MNREKFLHDVASIQLYNTKKALAVLPKYGKQFTFVPGPSISRSVMHKTKSSYELLGIKKLCTTDLLMGDPGCKHIRIKT